MLEIKEEELFQIIENLNRHTSEAEYEEFQARRENDPDWDSKVREVEEMQSMHRYIEARSFLKKIWDQENESVPAPISVSDRLEEVSNQKNEPRIIPIGQRPGTWLMAASIAALLAIGGRYLYLEYSKQTDIGQETGQNKVLPKDSTQPNSESQTDPSAEFMANTLIAEDLELNNIPTSLEAEAQAIAIDINRKKGIATLEKLAPPSPAPDNKKPGEILLGSSPDEIAKKSGLSSREEAYRKLLLGVGYLKEEKPQEALKVLNQVKEASLVQEVAWYKALALIKTGKMEEARVELEKITDSRYFADAQELLSNLPQ